MLEEHHEKNVPNNLDDDCAAYAMPQEVISYCERETFRGETFTQSWNFYVAKFLNPLPTIHTKIQAALHKNHKQSCIANLLGQDIC